MSNYLDVIGLNLPATTEAGRARRQVLASEDWSPTATTMVSYISSNRILIIATEAAAKSIEKRLPEKMQTYLAISADESSPATISNGWNVAQPRINGFLGRFEVFVDSDDTDQSTNDNYNLGLLFNIANGLFDQIIDCNESALIAAAVKPPGYYHVGDNEQRIDAAVEQLSELIGEFDKPKFFDYDPDICAHGNSGISGCRKCIEACPTEAIISVGDKVQVNPHLCQGGGSCTSVCPSGAISYTFPKVEEQTDFLRGILRDLRNINGNRELTLLFYDSENGGDAVAEAAVDLPEHIIPFMVEEIGSIGLDLMACALAYGANQIYLYAPVNVPEQVIRVIGQNVHLLTTVLQDLQLEDYQLYIVDDLQQLQQADNSTAVIDKVATFAPIGNKRKVIHTALSHLNAISPNPATTISLPDYALFGQINVDSNACTLCMACVSVCPGKALQDGGELPALKFIEANCLQCGICASACPEQAISLEARLNFAHESIHTATTLKEEQPFRCIRCGKAFATKSIIEKMTAKLKGHWMFENEDALKRLQMCEDCRVIDAFSNDV